MGPSGSWRYESGRTFYALRTRDLVLTREPNHHQSPATQITTAHDFLNRGRTNANSIHLYNWQQNRISRIARDLGIEHLQDLTMSENNITRLMEIFLETWPCWKQFNRDEQQVAADIIVKWLRAEDINRWFDKSRVGDDVIQWDETHYPAPEEDVQASQRFKSKAQQISSEPGEEHDQDYEQEEGLDSGDVESVDEEQEGWQTNDRHEFVAAGNDSDSDFYRVIYEHERNPLRCGQIVQLRRIGKEPGKLYLISADTRLALADMAYGMGTC